MNKSFPKIESHLAFIGGLIAIIVLAVAMKMSPVWLAWWSGILVGMHAFAPKQRISIYFPYAATASSLAFLGNHGIKVVVAAALLMLTGVLFVRAADFIIGRADGESSKAVVRNLIYMFLLFLAFNTLIASAVGLVTAAPLTGSGGS